jgi:hypothetical protein
MSAISPTRLPRTKGGSVRTWSTDEIRTRLDTSGADPIGAHIRILRDEQHCLACHGDGRIRYDVPAEQQKACQCVVDAPDPECWRCDGTGIAVMKDRICNSCHGDKREKLTVAQVQASANELMKYTCQTLKQVEVSGNVDVGVSMVSRLAAGRDRARGIVVPIAAKVIEAAMEDDGDDS